MYVWVVSLYQSGLRVGDFRPCSNLISQLCDLQQITVFLLPSLLPGSDTKFLQHRHLYLVSGMLLQVVGAEALWSIQSTQIWVDRFSLQPAVFLEMDLPKCGLHASILPNDSYFTSLYICSLACHTLKLHEDNVMFMYITSWQFGWK